MYLSKLFNFFILFQPLTQRLLKLSSGMGISFNNTTKALFKFSQLLYTLFLKAIIKSTTGMPIILVVIKKLK